MRTRDPIPNLAEQNLETLIDELCLALRDVGVSTQYLPEVRPPQDISHAVGIVQCLAEELRRRDTDLTPRLKTLSEETKWKMSDLYAECLSYPATRPWVKAASDGLRIALRCKACDKNEFPEHSQRLRLCCSCLDNFDTALAMATPREFLLLYRTYTKDARCEHADDDTVLGVYPWVLEYSDCFPLGFCRICIANEQSKRSSSP